MDYKAYLAKIVALTRQAKQPETQTYPLAINSPARRALYDNLKAVQDLEAVIPHETKIADNKANVAEATALAIDDAIRRIKKADWRGNKFKEREVRNAIKTTLNDDDIANMIFEIAKAQRDY